MNAVKKGRELEHAAVKYFKKYPILLHSRAGPMDGGIDIRGKLLSKTVTADVIIQCKHENRSLPPVYLRELEGCLQNESAGTIGIMFSGKEWSKTSKMKFHSSKFPMMGFVWNSNVLLNAFVNMEMQEKYPQITVRKTIHGKVELIIDEEI